MKMPGQRKRWAIAVRVSTDEQDVEQQVQALTAAAERHLASVAVVVRIEGESAWDPKSAREVQRKMLAPIEAGQADVLAVWALDRMTRQGIVEALAFIQRLEGHLGAELFSLNEPFLSTATMDPKTRELVASLMAWLAQQESERKSERVKAKREAKVNRAAVLGQQATWGRGALAMPEQVARVWVLHDEKRSVRDIGTLVGVSKSQVARILARPRPVPMGPSGRAGLATDETPPSSGGGLGQAARSGEPNRPSGFPTDSGLQLPPPDYRRAGMMEGVMESFVGRELGTALEPDAMQRHDRAGPSAGTVPMAVPGGPSRTSGGPLAPTGPTAMTLPDIGHAARAKPIYKDAAAKTNDRLIGGENGGPAIVLSDKPANGGLAEPGGSPTPGSPQ